MKTSIIIVLLLCSISLSSQFNLGQLTHQISHQVTQEAHHVSQQVTQHISVVTHPVTHAVSQVTHAATQAGKAVSQEADKIANGATIAMSQISGFVNQLSPSEVEECGAAILANIAIIQQVASLQSDPANVIPLWNPLRKEISTIATSCSIPIGGYIWLSGPGYTLPPSAINDAECASDIISIIEACLQLTTNTIDVVGDIEALITLMNVGQTVYGTCDKAFGGADSSMELSGESETFDYSQANPEWMVSYLADRAESAVQISQGEISKFVNEMSLEKVYDCGTTLMENVGIIQKVADCEDDPMKIIPVWNHLRIEVAEILEACGINYSSYSWLTTPVQLESDIFENTDCTQSAETLINVCAELLQEENPVTEVEDIIQIVDLAQAMGDTC